MTRPGGTVHRHRHGERGVCRCLVLDACCDQGGLVWPAPCPWPHPSPAPEPPPRLITPPPEGDAGLYYAAVEQVLAQLREANDVSAHLERRAAETTPYRC